MIQIFHNSRCGKSRNALEFLKKTGKDFEVINYLQEVPSHEALEKIIHKLAIKPIDLVRKKETIWIEHYKTKKMSDKEIIQAMVEHPILIERPIIINENKAYIARTPEAFEGIF